MLLLKVMNDMIKYDPWRRLWWNSDCFCCIIQLYTFFIHRFSCILLNLNINIHFLIYNFLFQNVFPRASLILWVVKPIYRSVFRMAELYVLNITHFECGDICMQCETHQSQQEKKWKPKSMLKKKKSYICLYIQRVQ